MNRAKCTPTATVSSTTANCAHCLTEGFRLRAFLLSCTLACFPDSFVAQAFSLCLGNTSKVPVLLVRSMHNTG